VVHRRLIMPIFRRVTTEDCLKFLSEFSVGRRSAL
jgi:hypothetical protein